VRRLVWPALAAALLAACGNKTPVLPPELVQPRPAGALAARPAKAGVVLTWRRPVEYTGGGRMNDLGGFLIERAPGDGPGDYARIGTLELNDQTRFRPERDMEWTDTTAVPGTRYRYRVIAFTLDDYESAPAGPVTVQFDPPGTASSPPSP
jgi:hypothetical protein